MILPSKAVDGQLPPHSNTGVSSPSQLAEAHFRSCLSGVSSGQKTLIDTISLVFPILSAVPDWQAVDVSVGRGISAAEAKRLPKPIQISYARAWWGEGRECPPDSVLVAEWVNTLYRSTVAIGGPSEVSCGDDAGDIERALLLQRDQLLTAFDWMFHAFGIALSPRNKGINGFRYSAALVPAEWDYFTHGSPPSLGHLAWGGITDKGGVVLAQLHLTGQGCAEVSMGDNWGRLYNWAVDMGAHLTRCDVALDDFQGENGGVSSWVDRYHQKAFAIRQNPKHKIISGDDGDTLYVGSRDSGKMCRIYAKGLQLGDADSPWVRIEVELHNEQRVIPLGIMIAPDDYFAGAYPVLETVNVSDVPCPISTVVRNTAACTLKSLTHHAKRSYGKLLDVMSRLGYTADEILDSLRVSGVPDRLRSVSFVGGLDAYSSG